MSGLTVPTETTQVVLSSKTADGIEVSQMYPIQHPQGAEAGTIFGASLQILRGMGGLLVDIEPGKMKFYPLTSFVEPVTLEFKSILLATGDALPPKSKSLLS